MSELWGEHEDAHQFDPSLLSKIKYFLVIFLGIPTIIIGLILGAIKLIQWMGTWNEATAYTCIIGILIFGWFLVCFKYAFIEGD